MATIGYPLYGLAVTGARDAEKVTRTINGINLPADYQEGSQSADLVQQFGRLLFAAATVDFSSMQVVEKREVASNG